MESLPPLPPAAAEQELWTEKAKSALRNRDYAALEKLDKHTMAGALHHFPSFVAENNGIKADIKAALTTRDQQRSRDEDRKDRTRSHKVNLTLSAVAVASAIIAVFALLETHRQTKIAEAAANDNRVSVAELQKQVDTLERRIAILEKSDVPHDAASKTAPAETEKPVKAAPAPPSSDSKGTESK